MKDKFKKFLFHLDNFFVYLGAYFFFIVLCAGYLLALIGILLVLGEFLGFWQLPSPKAEICRKSCFFCLFN